MRIGILGGSFNPPHEGHIHISLEARKRLGLKQIWWLPAKQNPLKTAGSNFEEKLKNCQKITQKYPKIIVKNYEKHIKSFYSIDILQKIIKKHPKKQFFFIIGADNILQFHRWKNWQKIIKICPIIIANREGFFHQAMRSRAFIWAKKKNRVHFLKIKTSPQSSTKIRENYETI